MSSGRIPCERDGSQWKAHMPPLGHEDAVDPKPKLLGLTEDLSRFCQITILLLLLAHSADYHEHLVVDV